LDSKQIYELHVDADSFSEFSLELDIDVLDCIDRDGVNGCNGGYNDEGHDNGDWAHWDENNHEFYMIPFCASSGYKPPRSRQKPVSPDTFSMLYFDANLFEEIAAETNRNTYKTTCTA
jgi:hypothetical protein